MADITEQPIVPFYEKVLDWVNSLYNGLTYPIYNFVSFLLSEPVFPAILFVLGLGIPLGIFVYRMTHWET